MIKSVNIFSILHKYDISLFTIDKNTKFLFDHKINVLSPVHTKNDNYKDKDISVHTSERYRLSACASATLNSRTHYCRMDSDWLSVFLSFISWKNCSGSDSNGIVSLCLYHYSCGVWTLLFFNTVNDF